MNIYLFELLEGHEKSHDFFYGFVVSAKSVKEASQLVIDKLKDAETNQYRTSFTCKMVGYKIDSKSEIILSDFFTTNGGV